MTTEKELLDFFKYLERRGFLKEDLQCDPEHQVETYLRDFYKDDEPTETQYVDLGLPSGTLWATCNVGASKPEELGGYFTHYDAMNLGVTLPTKRQINELITKCACIWTIKNGVNGRMFAGPNGNTIFLPAAGYNHKECHYDVSSGYYWSRDFSDDANGYARYIYFDWCGMDWDTEDPDYEQSVRAVKKKEE